MSIIQAGSATWRVRIHPAVYVLAAKHICVSITWHGVQHEVQNLGMPFCGMRVRSALTLKKTTSSPCVCPGFTILDVPQISWLRLVLDAYNWHTGL